MTRHTDLGGGFVSMGAGEDHYGDDRGLAVTAVEIRERDIRDLKRALAAIEWNLENALPPSMPDPREVRRLELEAERESVLRRLADLGELVEKPIRRGRK